MSVYEEIDIIELLQRVKEGKAPKRIEIDGIEYYYNAMYNKDCFNDFSKIYESDTRYWSIPFTRMLDTKIKILDNSIIGKLDLLDLTDIPNTVINIGQKINEIIDYINKNKEDE